MMWWSAHTPWALSADALEALLALDPSALAESAVVEPFERPRQEASVAVIPVRGWLFGSANLITRVGLGTAMDEVGQELAAALADPNVDAVLLDVDSPGGEVAGTAEFAEQVHAAGKPTVAYAGALAASGAYWIASAADEIVAAETALVGSIGVRTALVDDSGRLAREGVKRYEIVSSQSPHKALDPSLEADRTRVQRLLDDLGAVFIAKVARNRGASEQHVLEHFGKGDVLVSRQALSAGMVDAVGYFDQALQRLLSPSRRRPAAVTAADPTPAPAVSAEESARAMIAAAREHGFVR